MSYLHHLRCYNWSISTWLCSLVMGIPPAKAELMGCMLGTHLAPQRTDRGLWRAPYRLLCTLHPLTPKAAKLKHTVPACVQHSVQAFLQGRGQNPAGSQQSKRKSTSGQSQNSRRLEPPISAWSESRVVLGLFLKRVSLIWHNTFSVQQTDT